MPVAEFFKEYRLIIFGCIVGNLNDVRLEDASLPADESEAIGYTRVVLPIPFVNGIASPLYQTIQEVDSITRFDGAL